MLKTTILVLRNGRVILDKKHSSNRGLLATTLFVVTLLFLFLSSAGAGPMPVPMNLQVEIFKRMFHYDKALANEADLVVFVVYEEGGPVRPDDTVKAFEGVGLASVAVRLDVLTSQSRTPSAVYLLPSIDSSSVRRYCSDKGVLSLSGEPELAENGSVAVSIGEENSRPQIIVNMRRLQDEGHNFSAQLLRLAKVIQ